MSIQTLTPELAEEFDVPGGKGALVAQVLGDDSPASKAGLQAGDVIVSFGGEPVESSQDLSMRVASVAPGTKAEVEYIRKGDRRTAQVKVARRDERAVAASSGGAPGEAGGRLGISGQDLTSRLAQQLGTSSTSGVVVAGVEPGGPADDAGLARGDIIHEANRAPVENLSQLTAEIAKVPKGGRLLLRIERIRGGVSGFLYVPVEVRSCLEEGVGEHSRGAKQVSYRLESGCPAEEIRRVADEEIAAALSGLANPDRATGVHEARRRLNRLRALARLARAPLGRRYPAENRRFRDLARRLAAPRDAQVMRETFDRLFPGPRSGEVTASGGASRCRGFAHLASGPRAAPPDSGVASQLFPARARAARWPISPSAGFAELEPGLKRTYRRARRALGRAARDGTVDVFHDWRKMKARRRSLSRLSALLGEAHDLAVLHEWLRRAIERRAVAHAEPRALQRLDHRRLRLERLALPAGRRLFAEKPSAFARRLGVFWEVWKGEG